MSPGAAEEAAVDGGVEPDVVRVRVPVQLQRYVLRRIGAIRRGGAAAAAASGQSQHREEWEESSWHCLRPFAGMIRIRFDGSTRARALSAPFGTPRQTCTRRSVDRQ